MRLFLAIDFTDKFKKNIGEQVQALCDEYPSFQWITPAQYHITVRFFGEYSPVEKLKEKITNGLFDSDPFWLYTRHMGLFMKHHITLYVGFRRSKELEKIVKSLGQEFGSSEFDHSVYVPHLTIARCKIPSKQQYFLLQKKLGKSIISAEYEVKKFTLLETVEQYGKTGYKKHGTFYLGQ